MEVMKRDGEVVNFDPVKIKEAILKAAGSTQVESIEKVVQEVVDEIEVRFSDNDIMVNVENIHDIVEKVLMRRDLYDVAKSYIVHRAQKRQRETEDRKKLSFLKSLKVKKKDGTSSAFSPKKVKSTIKRHAAGLNIDENLIFQETVKNVFDGIKSEDIDKTLILSATSVIEQDPDYSVLASRFFRQRLAKEVFCKSLKSGSEEWEQEYRKAFIEGIKLGVAGDVLDERLLDFDLEKLAKALVLDRDDLIKFIGVNTLYGRYFTKVGGRRLEMPQMFWMRVAMGLAINEEDKNEKAVEFYSVMSPLYCIPSTPTLLHSGFKRPQLSSCFLSSAADDLNSIYDTFKDNANLAKYSGGIGNDWTNVRAMGALVNSTKVDSQGLIPFLKIANDGTIAINRSGNRRGATVAYLETWHLDIEDFLDLRRNSGDDRRRTRDMNTANWIPDLFMKRVREKGDWTLFSPDEVPDLHHIYGKKFEERYVQYEEKARQGEIKNFKVVKAQSLYRKMITSLFETGNFWFCFKDPCNVRSPQDHAGVVHSSNLCCVAGDQLVATQRGLLTVKKMYEDQRSVWGLAGKDRMVVSKTPMLKPRPDAPMRKIVTKEGFTHKVTPDHKVWVIDQGHKEAKDLVPGDKIALQSKYWFYGASEDPDLAFFFGAFIRNRWICWDGTAVIKFKRTDFEKLNKLIFKYFSNHNTNDIIGNLKGDVFEIYSGRLLDLLVTKGFDVKQSVPDFVFAGDEMTVCSFLRGVHQEDLGKIEKAFAEQLQILWINIGVKTLIVGNDAEGYGLIPTEKSKTFFNSIVAGHAVSDKHPEDDYYAVFDRLEELPNEDAYCLEVDSEDHLWTVNGILTKNTEITLNTDPTIRNELYELIKLGEVAVCNLSSLNLVRFMKLVNGKWEMDWELLAKVIRTQVRMLDNVIDINFYPIPEAKYSNLKHRPVGLGSMGLQDALFLADINYEEADDFVDELQEFISYHAIWASSALAAERGTYESYKGSKWDRGIFPLDSLDLLERERGIPINVDRKSRQDWSSLKQHVSTYGMRNSNVMAVAPTACVKCDTIILTDKGLLPIGSLGNINGDQWQNLDCIVATDGNKKTANKFYLNGIKSTLTITTKRGHKITCTPNHRLRVVDEEGNYVWKYAADIKEGDLVVRKIGGHQELLGNANLIKLNIDETPKRRLEKDFNCPELMDEKLAEMLGYYMGDGYLRNHDLGLVVADIDEDLVEYWRNYFVSIGLNLSVEQKKTNVKVLHIFSKRLERWFDINELRKPCGNHGEGSAGAFIPEQILRSKSSVLCAFLRGIFEAEGTILVQKKGSLVVGMSTVNETLAEQIQVCLESLGIRASRTTCKPGTKGKRPVHRVRMSNVASVQNFKKIIGFISTRKKKVLVENIANDCFKDRGEYAANTALVLDFKNNIINCDKKDSLAINECFNFGRINIGFAKKMIDKYPFLKESKISKFIDANLELVEVKSVCEGGEVMTCDISVPEKNAYVANGFVSHNTIATLVGVIGEAGASVFKNLFAKNNISGEFTVINEYLVNDLKKIGLWDKEMLDLIKYHNGSIQKIDKIPKKIRNKYKEAFEIDQKRSIDLTALRTKWIDQSQSHNVFVAGNNGNFIADLYMYAWEKGLKTTYYLRTLGVSGAEKSTLDTKYGLTQKREDTSVKACSLQDPTCESCQ